MEKSWFHSKKVNYVPIFSVACLVVVYIVVNGLFVACYPKLAKCEPFNPGYIFSGSTTYPINVQAGTVNGKDQERKTNLKIFAERYGRRFVWAFLIAFSVLLTLASLITSGTLIHKSASFGDESPSTRVKVSLILSFAFGVILWLFPEWYMPVMENILNSTIADSLTGVPVILGIMKAINSLTYVAAIAIVICACAILLPRKAEGKTVAGNQDDAATEKLSVLSEQMKDLRVVLYVSTLLLIIGVLRMNAVTQWSLTFISPDAVEAAQTFFISMSSVIGGFYSLILAAVYLPAAFILQQRAKFVSEGLTPDKRPEALKSQGFTFSFRETMPRIIAILGPLLAGPIGELFKSVPA